jgi:glycosyltransferase involved in cell wall biosynthesis
MSRWKRARIPRLKGNFLRGFSLSDCPSQTFSWQVAQYCERLVETEEIDVIEAQEWEAPLYYLQLRRAFGLGPHKQPPCLIHLHSPTRLIFQHNQWDTSLTDFLPLSRREEYSIQAADGLICPSRYLANEAERLFSLKPGAVQVIPYPLGDTPAIERTPETWERNSVCYVGRIELRKGVVEWVDAAVQVAESRSDVRFDFVGSDTSLTGGAGASVREYLDQRIPRHLRPRFRFHGSQSREDLLRTLATVSLAVVPSQWDNLPFTCIEAMSTGLPVLASPNGGMAELIADGESGWIASDATPAGLARSLRLALDTSGIRRAAMGAQASLTARRLCSNESILRRHLELRSQLARDGATKSFQVPGFGVAEEGRTGMGVVVTCMDRPELLQECLASVREQTAPAKMMVAVINERHRAAVGVLDRVQPIYVSTSSSEAARKRGANELLAAIPDCAAWHF